MQLIRVFFRLPRFYFVDASFIHVTGAAAWGARDSKGAVLLTVWGVIVTCPGADHAEAIAV